MNIGIDGYEANIENRVGIGRYAYEILIHLYPLVTKHDVIVFLPSRPRKDMPPETDHWHYRVVGPAKLWTFIGLPLAMREEHLDVMYSPTHYIPRFTSVPRVMAIMDLSYIKYPELFRAKDLYQLRNWTAYSAAKAAKIFTISEASKNDIIRQYAVPQSKVVVTYPGFTMTPITSVKHQPPKNYILSVGTLQPRKNYTRLIEAFSIFLKQSRQKFSDLQLVIIGKKGWLYESILSAPEKYGIEDRVKFLDFVPDSELPSFYQHALCFALPSLYEGFGLPVLEAMAYKCPVVVSNVSSLPEIAGGAGIYVDPDNVGSIAGGLLIAVRQRNLVQGRQRVNAGLEQVKKFTWEKAAQKTLAVLEQIGGAS
ncbi:MAG: glycosyltransferase family 1 protein [Candidatus Gottesmanbacteria bacterium]|nr:glycosyltransferase family 1 protein [Candidatus Gottesmanbacteria bacterium]